MFLLSLVAIRQRNVIIALQVLELIKHVPAGPARSNVPLRV